MNNETKQIDRPRCLACGELIGAEVECGLAFATEAEFASYRKRVWGEKFTTAAAQAQLSVATAPDLLASVRGALREAETLWSNLDNLRHEVSACEGLSETGSSDVQFKLRLAATYISEASAMLFAAASGRQSHKYALSEPCQQQLDELQHGKF